MRIRSIKPKFWRSDDIDVLDWEARLVFIALWSYVDDNGVGIDRLANIVGDMFSGDMTKDPIETIARVSRGLQALSETGRIIRYSDSGQAYLYVVNWKAHQKIDRPNADRFPLPESLTCGNAESAPENATPSRDPIETPSSRSIGEQENRRTGLSTKQLVPKAATEPDLFDEFWMTYPRKDDKGKAIKAYEGARKKASQAEIISGARRYADDPNRVDPYTKLPATWLHAGSWGNGPLPCRGGDAKPNAATQRNATNAETVRRLEAAESGYSQLAIGTR